MGYVVQGAHLASERERLWNIKNESCNRKYHPNVGAFLPLSFEGKAVHFLWFLVFQEVNFIHTLYLMFLQFRLF
jgi:hypothetical protein